VADLNTNINIVVKNLTKLKSLKKELKESANLAKSISKDFDRLDTLQKRSRRVLKPLDDIGRTDPRDSKGRYTKDPNRKRRQELYNKGIEKEIRLEQRLQRIRKRDIASNTVVKQEIANLKGRVVQQRLENRELQVKIQRIAKLKAAQGLVSRKLREAGSAGLSPTEFGGTEGKRLRGRRSALNEEVQNIRTGFESLRSAGVKNIETYRALGSQLSRTVEELNALNKASARRSVGFEKGRRLQERIDTVAASGYGKTGQIAAARKSAANVIAAGKTGDQNLYNQALSKATAQVSRLERTYKEADTVQKDASKQTSKRARAEARLQRMQKQRRGRIGKSMMIGGGFPLLFGGGFGQSIGGVVGGGLGEATLGPGGGFAGAIAAQAVIQTVTKVVTGVNKLGQSLNSLTADIGALTKSLGLVGTVEGERLRLIESLSGKQVALAEATRLLNQQIGTAATESLKIFNDKMKGMGNEFNKLLTKMSAVISELITDSGLLDFLHAITSFLNNLDVQKLKGMTQIMMGVSLSQYGMVAQGLKNLATDAFSDKKNDPTESTDKFKPVFEGQFKNIKEEKVHLLETITLGKTKAEINKKVFNFMEKIKTITKDLSKEEKASLEDQLIKRYEQLEILKTTAQLFEQIRQTIADGMVNAVEALIDKTKSLSEVLTGVLKQIARAFLSAGINSFVGGFKIGGKGITTVPTPFAEHVAAQGAYFSNGIKPFASGGMATRPTLGLVGEAGEDEYIIPASKMASSMQRYSAGARGEAVIPGTGSSYAGGGAGGSTTVNYSGPILHFNSEEFVPKSAVGQIIATATSQGARAGENRTLSTLRNSRSTRSRLGM